MTGFGLRLNYLWRLVVTGNCFFWFASGGALLSAIILPTLYLLPGGRRQRQLRARRIIGAMFGTMISILCLTGTMRLRVDGLQRLRSAKGSLILANHPTLIDVVILLWLHPTATCVVKADLWKNPFYWGVVRLAGYIDNACPESLLEACSARLDAGETLVIFPEGTRSRPGEPLQFLRGASHIALKHGHPLLPVLITCNPPTLTKGAPWYHIPPEPFAMTLSVREKMPLEALITAPEASAIVARRLTEALEDYFTQQLEAYGCT